MRNDSILPEQNPEVFYRKQSELAESKLRLVLHLFIFAFSFRSQDLLRASFALSAKNEFVSSGTCWGLRTPIPRGSISSHSFAEKSAKVFQKMIMARMKNPRHLVCFLKSEVSKIFDRRARR